MLVHYSYLHTALMLCKKESTTKERLKTVNAQWMGNAFLYLV